MPRRSTPKRKPIQAPKNVQRLGREPALIRYGEATRFLWGDEESHQVSDWVYGRGERIAAFMFSLRPGECFKWSKTWKPRYDQHRLYYVLQGELAIHDPQSGEVAVAGEGEAIFWQGNKWHFGYNFGSRETLILEGVAPPERSADTPEIEMSLEKPDLAQLVNGRYELLGKWPAERPRARDAAWREGGMVRIGRQECLHLICGEKTPLLVSLFVSTEVLTAGHLEILPGKMGDSEAHPGDEALFVIRGRLNVYLPDTYDWFEVNPKDSLYLPEGTRHQYANMSDAPLAFFFAVSPRYR